MNFKEIKSAHGPKSWNHTAEKNSIAERSIGIHSISYTYVDLLNPIKLLRILWNTEVFHFYSGYTLLPISTNHYRVFALLGGFDIRILKFFGKKVVLHFQGCELRDRFNPKAHVVCDSCQKKEIYCMVNRAKSRRNRMLANCKFADALTVSTPDLKAYLHPFSATWIPKAALRTDNSSSINIPDNELLKVIHAPSNRSIKGSNIIIDVLSKHKDKFELILLENVSRDEVYKQATQAHFAIDQIRIGWYGNFAVEMMSLGLPVVCNINKSNLDENTSDFPIIHATESNLEEVLLSIHNNRQILLDKASLNKKYLEQFHSDNAIAGRLRTIYQFIGFAKEDKS